MRLIVACVLAVGVTLPAQAQELSGDQIKVAVVSAKERMAKTPAGATFKFQFKADGTAVRQRNDNKMIGGKWTISGNKICTVWEDLGERCNTVVKKGKGYDMMADGKVSASY